MESPTPGVRYARPMHALALRTALVLATLGLTQACATSRTAPRPASTSPLQRRLTDVASSSTGIVAVTVQNLRTGERASVHGDVRLPIELALPCGMTVCELITNVYKYAFPGGRSGAASVNVRIEGDRVVLKVDDDGVGFPEGFSSAVKGSFGWDLIRALTMQLDGTVEATTDKGAHVVISFPAPDLDPEPT